MSLIIKPYKRQEKLGFDLMVKGDNVTVQDYLDHINKYILKGKFNRLRRDINDCEGCNGCCGERIPLTYIDVLNLSLAPYVKEIVGLENPKLKELVERIGQIIIEGRSVDIILDRNEKGECIFLDEDTKKCKIYQFRPLVCQTFICCQQSDRAEQLRNKIVNLGEDELVRQWLQECFQRQEPMFFHEAYEPDIRLEDWVETPFNTDKYEKVVIKDICNLEQWQNLSMRVDLKKGTWKKIKLDHEG